MKRSDIFGWALIGAGVVEIACSAGNGIYHVAEGARIHNDSTQMAQRIEHYQTGLRRATYMGIGVFTAIVGAVCFETEKREEERELD